MATKNIAEELEIAAASSKAAQQTADLIRQKQRTTEATARRVPTEDDKLIVLPGGKRVLASEFLEHKYQSISDIEQKFLADPGEFLLHRDPKYTYMLPDGESTTTQARIKANFYIPIKQEEMDLSKMAPTHEGSDGFVHWYRHVLVKCPVDKADALYKLPEQDAIRRLVGNLRKFESDVETVTGGLGTATVVRKYEKE